MASVVRNPELITAGQRQALFAWAGRRGLSIDDLRAATPGGSISKLSRSQAARMIERLSGRSGDGGRQAVPAEFSDRITLRQRGMLRHLQKLSGLSAAGFSNWLFAHFGFRSIEEIRGKSEASRVIGGLLRMHQNYEARLQGSEAR